MSGGTLEAECDLVRVGGRRHAEIVFELSLIAVVNQVDAGIDAFVLDAAKVRNIVAPFRRNIADEIVALARECFGAGHGGGGISSIEMHADDRRIDGRWLMDHS